MALHTDGGGMCDLAACQLIRRRMGLNRCGCPGCLKRLVYPRHDKERHGVGSRIVHALERGWKYRTRPVCLIGRQCRMICCPRRLPVRSMDKVCGPLHLTRRTGHRGRKPPKPACGASRFVAAIRVSNRSRMAETRLSSRFRRSRERGAKGNTIQFTR